MSSHLVPSSYGGVRLPRAVQQDLDRLEHMALFSATRMAAIGFATQAAMFQVASLSNLEVELIKASPLAERRLDAIVNTATALIASEVSRIGF